MVFNFPSSRKQKAFTLLELLAVVSIMGILMAIAIPAGITIVAGQRITQAVQTVVDEINFDRSAAASRNAVVEICFIQAPPVGSPNSASVFCGVGSRLVKNDGTKVWLRQVSWFPVGIVLGSTSTYSNIFGAVPVSTISPPEPRFTNYVGFSIRPSGALNPIGGLSPTDSWYVTVLNQQDLQAASIQSIKNYGVVQIDPLTGRTTVYRP